MNDRSQPPTRELVETVVVGDERGLSSRLARRISSRARAFDCDVKIEADNGKVASAGDLLQLLLLGIARGEQATIRCRGNDADAARRALVDIIQTSEGRT